MSSSSNSVSSVQGAVVVPRELYDRIAILARYIDPGAFVKPYSRSNDEYLPGAGDPRAARRDRARVLAYERLMTANKPSH